DRAKRFEAYGWQVLHINDANDLDEIEGAIADAQSDTDRHRSSSRAATSAGGARVQAAERGTARHSAKRTSRSRRRIMAGRRSSPSMCPTPRSRTGAKRRNAALWSTRTGT